MRLNENSFLCFCFLKCSDNLTTIGASKINSGRSQGFIVVFILLMLLQLLKFS